MEQSIKIPIKNKILHKKNILDIANYLEKIKFENDGNLDFVVKFTDERKVSSDNRDLFESRIFEEKEIETISMEYKSKDYKDRITIGIRNYDIYDISAIEISSESENFISNISYKLEELLSYCNQQGKIANILENETKIMIIRLLINMIIGFELAELAKRLLDIVNKNAIIIGITILIVILTLIVFELFERLQRAYPKVEIAIQDKTNTAKKRRKLFQAITTIIIIPIILNAIYDLLKFIFIK